MPAEEVGRMLRRAPARLCVTAVTLLWTSAQAAERPLGETIRAAAAAVRPAIVSIEVKGPGAAGQPDLRNLPFIQPPRPGERRQWRFEFQWPPREGDQPRPPLREFREQLPFLRFGRQPTKGTGVVVAIEGERALVAAPHTLVGNAEEMYVEGPGFKLCVPEAKANTLKAHLGKKLTFGIRPEDIHDREYAPPGIIAESVTATVDVTELMGSEVYVYLVSDSKSYIGRFDPRTSARVGKQVDAVFDMANVHFFDPDSEQALR